jgi:UDPglucose 6-dehydrogenase
MNITIIGTGFVGVVSSAVYASFGNQVVGLDIDPKKVASLQASKVPFF